jgi:hypothetical protein
MAVGTIDASVLNGLDVGTRRAHLVDWLKAHGDTCQDDYGGLCARGTTSCTSARTSSSSSTRCARTSPKRADTSAELPRPAEAANDTTAEPAAEPATEALSITQLAALRAESARSASPP